MKDTVIDLAVVARLARRRWPVLAVSAVVGAAVGFGLAPVLSPGYVSTSKVLLQGGRDAKELTGEPDIATSRSVLDQAAGAAGVASGADLRSQVSAALAGNILTISGSADTPERAQRITQVVTGQYVAFSSKIVGDAASAAADTARRTRDAVQRRFDEATARIQQLQRSPSINSNGADGDVLRQQIQEQRNAANEAVQDMQKLDSATSKATVDASMSTTSALIFEPAVLPAGRALPTPDLLVALGAVLAAALALFGHLLALRLDRRLHDATDIAAAAGTAVAALVPVEAAPAARSRLRRFLRDDRSWARPADLVRDDPRAWQARWNRVLRRLDTGGTARRWLLLTGSDDPTGPGVAAGLAAALAEDGPVTVHAAEPAAEQIRVLAAGRDGHTVEVVATTDEDLDGAGGTGGPAADAGRVVRLVATSARRPVVPDAAEFGTGRPVPVLVAGLGVRTAWEVAALSAACVAAGHTAPALVVAAPVRGARPAPDPVPPAGPDAAEATLAGAS